ncbi:MAG TPA: ATP-binding protein [Lachnospiraceae bacterium]|nr:ATP-binding protein [Lachnospiraceae bacterium]
MSAGKWMGEVADMLLAVFTVYLFFLYFGTFLERRKKSVRMVSGIAVLVLWQMGIPDAIHRLPGAWSIGATVVLTLFVVSNIFAGKLWMEVFFSVTFDAIWMLVEMLVGSLLIIYGESIVEQQVFGSFVSKILFFMAIQGLRKVFTDEKIMGLPLGHTMLIIFIPIGSIYIMNAVFMMAYRTEWEYVEIYSLVSGMILLVINVLVFYIYIKLADDLQVRRMNLVYEKQLDLCERHQEETEVSTLLVRDVRHGIRNHLIAILAYAEKGECGKLIKFVEDIIEDGKLGKSEIVNTGNIVTDSLTGYWKRTAENEGIEFEPELSIPMEMPFRGADISLIMGNLLENAVEGARGAERRRYIRFNMKYDKSNLLITVENSYKGKLVKGKGGELRTTKEDVTSHGIGLPSVQRAAGKYHGTVSVDDTVSGRFLVRVVLYGT